MTLAEKIKADFEAMRAMTPVSLVRAGVTFAGAAATKRMGKDYDPVTGGWESYDRTVRLLTDDLAAQTWTPTIGELVTVDGKERRVINTSAGPFGVFVSLDLGAKEA